jgi:hypothetical protein
MLRNVDERLAHKARLYVDNKSTIVCIHYNH